MRQNHQAHTEALASTTAFFNARARRTAAQIVETDMLRRALHDAQEAGLSLRDMEEITDVSRPTLARKRIKESLGSITPPSPHYDEDEWIAAADAACEYDPAEMSDRGPYRQEIREDGVHTVRLHLGTLARHSPGNDAEVDPSKHDDAYEPLQGITPPEYEHLQTHGFDGDDLDGDRARRILRRLARAVLRVQHPGVPRIGIILDAAIEGVRADIAGAMVLSDQAIPTASEDEGWVVSLRARRANGFYLPKWKDETHG